MKRFKVGKPTKLLGSIVATIGLVAASLFIAIPVASATNEQPSAEVPWAPASSLTLVQVACEEADSKSNVNAVYNTVPGEFIQGIVIDGVPQGESSLYLEVGTHSYSYDVVNGSTQETKTITGGSITIASCETEPEPPATPSSMVSYTVEDRCYTEGDIPVQVFQVISSAPNEVISNIRVNDLTAPPVTDQFRLRPGTYTVSFDVTNTEYDTFYGNVQGPSFTVVACEVVEPPVAPTIISAVGNPSTDPAGVTFTVEVDLGDSEAVQVNIAHGEEIFDTALVFTGSGTQTSEFVALPCGDYEFGVFLADSSVGPARTIPVTIKCEEPPVVVPPVEPPVVQPPVVAPPVVAPPVVAPPVVNPAPPVAPAAPNQVIPAGDTGSADLPMVPMIGGVLLLAGAALMLARRRKAIVES